MKQKEFLEILRAQLVKRNVRGIDEVLADYQEHFAHGLQSGKSEEEISEKLGNPVIIARAYEADTMIEEVKNPEAHFQFMLALKVVGRLLLLAPVNFFILFIPGMIALGVLAAGWSVAAAMGAVSVAILGLLPVVASLSLNFWTWVASISASIGILGMGILAAMIMFVITKLSVMALINFLRWNLRFILDK
jgi:uncharacterized membrane protein